MLEVKNLVKHFSMSGGNKVKAVNGISFFVNKNEILGIVGESGCGKSTLGRLILRLLEPTSGKVFFRGDDITALSRGKLLSKRRNMQMIFQNPFASFNPKIRIGKALMEICRYYGMNTVESRTRIEKLFSDTGLGEDLLFRWPRELSGGQLQRLAITRALLSEPSLIIADEPLSALDVSIQAQLINLLKILLSKKDDTLMLFISHDMNVVEYFCNRAAVMYAGMIMELLPAEELAYNALHPYTQSLRASAPKIENQKEIQETFIVRGETPNPMLIHSGCPFAPRCPKAILRCRESLPECTEVSEGHIVRCFCI